MGVGECVYVCHCVCVRACILHSVRDPAGGSFILSFASSRITFLCYVVCLVSSLVPYSMFLLSHLFRYSSLLSSPALPLSPHALPSLFPSSLTNYTFRFPLPAWVSAPHAGALGCQTPPIFSHFFYNYRDLSRVLSRDFVRAISLEIYLYGSLHRGF